MSLFPAYAGAAADEKSQTATSDQKDTTKEQWLENSSFALQDEQIKEVLAKNETAEAPQSTSDSSKSDVEPQQERVKKRKHKKEKKKRKRKAVDETPDFQPIIEFSGNEEYYVDKKPATLYKTINTLHKPACPRYRLNFRRQLGLQHWQLLEMRVSTVKRYYRWEREKVIEADSQALDENEYTLRLGQLNRKAMESPSELQVWLDLIDLQDRNPYKWSRLMLAEKKLDLVQRGLVYHPRNEFLYRRYIDTINITYPSFEISKMLDRLLAKDPYNYTLWTAQIMTTQATMARCNTPDVLRIYERSMQKMHHAQKQSVASDEVMLKLFNNCALFLRQAGLNEQFFALVKLALELNVSSDQFGDFAPNEEDQRTLIEYEELILQSGLPMNEIWLRIEKLRQGFNFLPCPINAKCSDPQRIVFNEDVCHYIYPLKSRENSFYLMLLVLRLLKLPFVQCDGLAEKFCARVEHIGDSDAIEDLLVACLRRTFALSQQPQNEFLSSIYELAKEMAVSPTFLSSNIGHEIYTRCIMQLLMNCAAAYAGIDERKRVIFLLLWCRFERLLLVLQKITKKLSADYVKAGRSRFKALLKQPSNRNVLNLYTEFAMYEYEALQPSESLEPVQKTCENLIAAHNAADEAIASDLCFMYLMYAEMLLGRDEREQALQVLVAYTLSQDIKSKAAISMAKKLAALQQITERLDNVIAIERNVEIMVLEQYLLPDYTVSLIKMRTLILCLLGKSIDALAYLDRLLGTFLCDSDRHRFLREHIFEVYISVMQLPSTNCIISSGLLSEKLFKALSEYPRNVFLLQCAGMLSTVPWYKIRAVLLRNKPTILAVTFLIALARYRFIQTRSANAIDAASTAALNACDHKYNELIVRNRILNMFQTLTATTTNARDVAQKQQFSALQRNALFWRLYLRCLSDQCTAFETSKKCLLTALDECPWSKALYLDGATYVPQELTQLQDLIIEKQLRIYALPEELEILREQ